MNNFFNTFKVNRLKVLILSNFGLLLFVLNIPGTIALRNTLAVLLLVILSTCVFKSESSIKSIFKNKNFKNTVVILMLLTIYMFFHTIFIADEISWSLSQFRTQWIYPVLYFTMGILLAFLSSSDKFFNKETLINVIFFTLLIHILYIDIVALYEYLKIGHIIFRYGGLTGSPVLASYITNILISIVIVEIIYRFRKRKKIIKINFFWLISILILCIFSSVIEHMRFGVISLFFMSLAGFIFFITDNNKFNLKFKYFISLLIVILCSLPLIYSLQNDARWVSLVETIPIAIDTDTNKYWQGGDLYEIPKLSSGQNVGYSNYLRIAWIAKGLEYISNDIFGIGYGRNVFGHAIEKYDGVNAVRGYHSHSSIIDYTIGVGLFGLIIWLIFISKIFLFSAKRYMESGNYFSLLTFFVVSGFFVRSFVDSNMRDHMFKQFFLLLGISLMLSIYEKKKNS